MVTVLSGDSRTMLATLPDASVLDYRVMAETTWHAEHRPTAPHLNPQDTALTQDGPLEIEPTL